MPVIIFTDMMKKLRETKGGRNPAGRYSYRCDYCDDRDLFFAGRSPDADHKNYDTFWDQDVYPCKTIYELNDASTDTDLWFLKEHVGDWAYPDYAAHLINR